MSAANTKTSPIKSIQIEDSILVVRGQRVIIDADLATLYGVPTKRLNEQVKRNKERFPADFMFALTEVEKAEVVANCDHLKRLKFSTTLPFVFTEHGAIQAANVLASTQAIETGVYVVRAFVRLREMVISNKDLALRLDEVETKIELMALKHDILEDHIGCVFECRSSAGNGGTFLHSLCRKNRSYLTQKFTSL